MKLENILKNVGLSDKEAKVYLSLLTYKEALPSSIAKKAGLKRPTVYVILESLCKKGLATKIEKNSNLFYQSVSPNTLLDQTYNKFRSLEKALPDLLQLNSMFLNKPNVSFFEGSEGLMQIMDDTLMHDNNVFCYANAEQALSSEMKEHYLTRYIPTKVKRKVWVTAIFNYDKTALILKKRGKKELRDVYMIPKDDFEIKNEINIYADKVAIISHQDKIGVIVQNQTIADTQRSIFKFALKYAKLIQDDILTIEDKKYLEN